MAFTPQQKILHVANELGITDMKNMQGTTRVLYHQQNAVTGAGAALPNITFFGDTLTNAQFIAETNVPAGSKLQVNEALLVEKVHFHRVSAVADGSYEVDSYMPGVGGPVDIIFSLYVGNKRVIKDVRTSIDPFFMDGQAFTAGAMNGIFLEGTGILIPPQVEFYVEAKLVNTWDNTNNTTISYNVMCSLYGTGVLLNLNTSL